MYHILGDIRTLMLLAAVCPPLAHQAFSTWYKYDVRGFAASSLGMLSALADHFKQTEMK